MKILHLVENYYPSVGGMQEVVRQLSERMAAAGHEVTVACGAHPDRHFSLHNGVKIVSFSVSGSLVSGMRGETEAYREFLLKSDQDIVTLFAAQIWSTDIALPILTQMSGKKVFVPTGFSALHQPAFRDYYISMKSWMKAFDRNVFLSENYRDIHFAKENGITKNSIIPNAADEREFDKADGISFREEIGMKPGEKLILHVGSFTGLKGHLEALQIFNRISSKAVLCFIGNDYEHFPRYKRTKLKWWREKMKAFLLRKRVIILPSEREQTVRAFAAADVFLFPSNIECSPLVLFEAMAAGTAFLATDVGNSAEIVSWTSGGMIMPTYTDEMGFSHVRIEEGTRLLDELIANESQRKKLAGNGRAAWKERFTWKKICDNYLSLYNELLHQE